MLPALVIHLFCSGCSVQSWSMLCLMHMSDQNQNEISIACLTTFGLLILSFCLALRWTALAIWTSFTRLALLLIPYESFKPFCVQGDLLRKLSTWVNGCCFMWASFLWCMLERFVLLLSPCFGWSYFTLPLPRYCAMNTLGDGPSVPNYLLSYPWFFFWLNT